MARAITTKKPATVKDDEAEAKTASILHGRTGIVTVPGIKLDTVQALVIGTAPLIVNKFSEKAQQMMRDKQEGVASAGREKKDPEALFQAARHRLSDGSDGLPAGGMKACIASGCDRNAGLAKTVGKGSLRVQPDDIATNLVRIITPHEPVRRVDPVRNESGVADIRHRPEYWPWALLLRVEFVPQKATVAQVLQAIEMAGFTIGLAEWRPGSKKSLSGTYGTFRLATLEEIEAFEDGNLFGEQTQRLAAE